MFNFVFEFVDTVWPHCSYISVHMYMGLLCLGPKCNLYPFGDHAVMCEL